MTYLLQQDLQHCFEQIAKSITVCRVADSKNLRSAFENIEKLAIIAADTDRNGFQDTCLLIQDKFNQIVEEKGQLDEHELFQLRQWTDLAANYLRQSNRETAEALTGFFTISELYDDLNNNDLKILKELLAKEFGKEQSLNNEVTIPEQEPVISSPNIHDYLDV